MLTDDEFFACTRVAADYTRLRNLAKHPRAKSIHGFFRLVGCEWGELAPACHSVPCAPHSFYLPVSQSRNLLTYASRMRLLVYLARVSFKARTFLDVQLIVFHCRHFC